MENEPPNIKLATTPAHAEIYPVANIDAVVDAAETFLKTLADTQRHTALIHYCLPLH